MDLAYGPEYEAFRAEVRDFIQKHGDKAPKRFGVSRPSEESIAWQKLLIEHGYAARTIPKEYGGYGAEPDILKSRIIAEEFTLAKLPMGLANQGISMLVPTLLELGTEEQKKKWIEPTLKGEVVWCQGYSEPGSGSDLASLQTRAKEDGDDFIINGQKIWTSTAHAADMIFCLVRTEPDAKKHEGISYLIFSMKTPGIEVRPLKTMTGHAEFNEVFFMHEVHDFLEPRSRLVRIAQHAALMLQRGVRDIPALPAPGDDVLLRHAYIGEEDFVELGMAGHGLARTRRERGSRKSWTSCMRRRWTG